MANQLILRSTRWFAVLSMLPLASCSKEKGEPPPIVSVQAAPVKHGSISQTVTADAVLFPTNQATITPKIASPVLKTYVTRGSKVHQGQLLVELENKDLAAAAEEKRGNFESVQAQREIATKNSIPEELTKAESDAQAAQENLDAQQKLFDSRQNLFNQGAIPRKDLDAAAVSLVQARAQFEQAQKHLAGLKTGGTQQALNSANAQFVSAEGQLKGAEA